MLLTVRGMPLARYTLPDFFPDLNAREDATVDLEPLEKGARLGCGALRRAPESQLRSRL